MRTDSIFYQLFQTFPGLLFELLGTSPSTARNYEFSSREIKELARRFDGIFLPQGDKEDLPIYFVEVQFQPKIDFYWRFVTEIFVYLGQYQPVNDWYAVAVFANSNLDPGIPRQYRGLRNSGQIKCIYLDELTNLANPSLGIGIIQLVVEKEDLAIVKTQELITQARVELEDNA